MISELFTSVEPHQINIQDTSVKLLELKVVPRCPIEVTAAFSGRDVTQFQQH
jgi:hypothetical protein